DQRAEVLGVSRFDALCSLGRLSDGGHPDHLPCSEARTGLHPGAVDAHLAGAQQLLQMAEAHLREVRGEPAVKAHAVLVASHDLLADAAHAGTIRASRKREHSATGAGTAEPSEAARLAE